MSHDGDMLTELLIVRLLDEDMRALADSQEAEKAQLNQALADSAVPTEREQEDKSVNQEPPCDADIALKLFAEDVRLRGDAALAQSLQHSEDANIIAGQHHAQRLAAIEKKILLDAEFARQLQAIQDRGETNIDDAKHMDAERPRARYYRTIANMNDKGKGVGAKGKRRRSEFEQEVPSSKHQRLTQCTEGEQTIESEGNFGIKPTPYPTCGICLEPFQATYSPLAASASANSSAHMSFGLRLPCPGSHAYCLACLGAYIRTTLDPEGNGSGNSETVVFPIRCPECPLMEWIGGIPDETAERILPEKEMTLWHHQKLLDSLPRYYCPNPQCSALVQVHDDPNQPQATCPSCSTMICVPCRVVWHTNMTCEEYQALPLDERSPEDIQALQLMKAENWRRCPKCTFIIELTIGCHHVTCRCKTQFCFRCGSLWDVSRGRCMRDPPCDLWDEDMLLEERERRREREQEQRAGAAVPDPVAPPAPHAAQLDELAIPRVERDAFAWMVDRSVLARQHAFTKRMVASLTCGYCNALHDSLADLQYHLRHVRRHHVYACCGRFFKREEDYARHQGSSRHGHTYRVRTDD